MREISVGKFVIREFKGTLDEVREFCRGIMVGQIIAFGIGLQDTTKVHMVYYASPPDAVTDDEQEAVAAFAHTLLNGDEFGYASNFSFAPEAGIRVVSAIGMDRRCGESGKERKVAADILKEMCVVERCGVTNLQFVFPPEMEMKTTFEKERGSHFPVATQYVKLDSSGRVLYGWDQPNRNERGKVQGTNAVVFTTSLRPDLYAAVSLCDFPKKNIKRMWIEDTADDGEVVVHLVFTNGKTADIILRAEGDTFTLVGEPVVLRKAAKNPASTAAQQYAVA